MMLVMDPPEHDRFKLLVSRGFTPRNAELLPDRIEELAREIVDDVVERGECDLVHDISGRLPSGLIAELMGIPRADGERLYELTEMMHTTDDAVATPEQRGRRRRDARSTPARRRSASGRAGRRHRHGARAGRGRRRSAHRRRVPVVLPAARQRRRGHDPQPPRAGVQLLFDHPDERARLQADLDGLLATAVEEMLRYTSPVVALPPHRDGGHRRGRPADRRRRQADGVLRLRPTATRTCSPTPTASTSAATPTPTWRSVAAARTCASASTSPASRSPSCSASC